MKEKERPFEKLSYRAIILTLRRYAVLLKEDKFLAEILTEVADRLEQKEQEHRSDSDQEEDKLEVGAKPAQQNLLEPDLSNDAISPESSEELEPQTIFFPNQVYGKEFLLDGATDFLRWDSEVGEVDSFSPLWPINFISEDENKTYPIIEKTILAFDSEVDRNNPPSVFLIDYYPRLRNEVSAICVQRLVEGLLIPTDGLSLRNRPYLHKELFNLGNKQRIIKLIREGYSVFPHFVIGTERYNFKDPLKRKKVIFEEASKTTIEGKPGNFWSDSRLAVKEFLPVIARTLSEINRGQDVLLSALHPVTREPIDTHSRVLFFQLIQQLLLANSSKGLINFISSPATHSAQNLTFKEPWERKPKPGANQLSEVDSINIRLTAQEKQIVEELERLFLGEIPWLDAHKQWLNEVGSKLLNNK